jgi:hypothetical protein
LYYAYHAGEDSAAKRPQTIAESRFATSGGLQGKECAIRAAAGVAVGGIATGVAGETDGIGSCLSERDCAASIRWSRRGGSLSWPRHCASPAKADGGAAGCDFGTACR